MPSVPGPSRNAPFAPRLTRTNCRVARLFNERRFPKGERVVKEGSGGRSTLKAGDYFGEIALIDQGARMATIVAATELACYGLTYWDSVRSSSRTARSAGSSSSGWR
jgi:hypothetical protein